MTKKKISHRIMATFLIMVFLPSLFPVNYLLASNNGPNAPEAASFEPVDATDMVNLVTGDMSYVLPLLNVPSPEGGYPISLAYHAGIAMEQEASWVGLGWNLNPGAINRGVNGYPDDWGKTGIHEFYYDTGTTQNYYSISAGVTFSGAYSVGLGASWGSNQSLGGYVSASAGLGGENGASIGGSIGTNGVGINGGFAGYSANISTSGVGVGYGFASGGGNNAVGLNLNYNYSSGLSGGVSVTQMRSSDGSKIASHKRSGMGINFSADGLSINGKVNGIGAGISTSSQDINSGDYDVSVASTGFFLPLYYFYIGYNKTKVKHSLFKYDNLFTSGILYPVNSIKTKTGNEKNEVIENNFMDVTILPRYDTETVGNVLLDRNAQLKYNNLVLPSYDNYSVTAQGLSGTLSPYFASELNLSGRGREEQNNDDLYAQYINNDLLEYADVNHSESNKSAVSKVNFTMSNAHSSFLRTETSQFLNTNNNNDPINAENLLNYYKTQNLTNYNNQSSLVNGELNRKREGNYIETFTNDEIRNGVFGFLEADGIDRSDLDTFEGEGIGAYRITTADGRTYHYSLPVYNFETFYRSFRENEFGVPDKENSFFEIQKTSPYATHWLLTAVTGPDYIDENNDGIPNGNDYGYWVNLEYGKWSDGYIWQTPNGRYDEEIGNDGTTNYSYSWGRKQLYYLDAIKTRTHTALFVKDLRKDNASVPKYKYAEKWNGGSFWDGNYSSIYEPQQTYKVFGHPGDTFYYLNNNNEDTSFLFESDLGQQGCHDIDRYSAQSTQDQSYFDIPKSYPLRLKKILLIKNEDLSGFTKEAENAFSIQKTGILYKNTYFKNTNADSPEGTCVLGPGYNFYLTPPNSRLNVFELNTSNKVVDVNDFNGLNLESSAQQVIVLGHDYSLAPASPSSDVLNKGRLTLNSVSFKGKGGASLIPPYKFSYKSSTVAYDYDKTDDWGYYENFPETWSLAQIQTPIGSTIGVEYEQDSYFAEAAYTKKIEYSLVSSATRNNYSLTVNFNGNVSNIASDFEVGRFYDFKFNKTSYQPYPDNTCCNSTYSTEYGRFKVLSVSSSSVTFDLGSSAWQFDYYNSNNSCSPVANGICLTNLSVYGEQNNYALTDLNGRKGGGVRVTSVSVSDDINSLVTEYDYTDPETGQISGITSFSPSKEEPRAMPYFSELPTPGVLYSHVKMVNKDYNGNIMGSTAYEFETLEPFDRFSASLFNLGKAFEVWEEQNSQLETNVKANKYTIKSALANIGRLKSVTSYNPYGQILVKKENTYKTNLDGQGEIGVTQESHKSLKRVLNDGNETYFVSSTSKITYPSVLEKTTTTQGDITIETSLDTYDFLSGQVLQSTTKDSKNREIRTTIMPAYEFYPSMGSAHDTPLGASVPNANMLAQEALTFTEINDNSSWKKVGAGITTWGNNWGNNIWRKHKSFTWNGTKDTDGFFQNYVGFSDNFDWNTGTGSNWKQLTEITRYDDYSMAVESKDINGNYLSTKMGYKESKPIVSSNAGYNEMFYSGAEDEINGAYGGEVQKGTATTSNEAHTGSYSLSLASGQNAFESTVNTSDGNSKKFKISVWVKEGQESYVKFFNGVQNEEPNGEESIRAGDWRLLNFYTSINNSANVYITAVGGAALIDDFRLHPIESSMTSYVYNQWGELSHIIGANNLATHYIYDLMGRLKSTETEIVDFVGDAGSGGFKKSSEINYTYKY
ncbi:hypothetical protein MAR621_03052 [Maribacter dokdonensis]|uniref:hypothetical protein n=1 Tax=Maribacter dokdonensis TaxID=320912 RepID=UPI001B2BD62C|nr:hypothetical protein [Maribacter dokdonensis]CAG2532858.1 hypothetical protein MAR621_03052 [Maribacter dokdonensis]